MITPYPEDINKIELKFFDDSGIEVTGYTHFECAKSKEITDIPARSDHRARTVRTSRTSTAAMRC